MDRDVDKLGFDKVIKANDDNITKWKQYDHFYQFITFSIIKLLSESLDTAVLQYPLIFFSKLSKIKVIDYKQL